MLCILSIPDIIIVSEKKIITALINAADTLTSAISPSDCGSVFSIKEKGILVAQELSFVPENTFSTSTTHYEA